MGNETAYIHPHFGEQYLQMPGDISYEDRIQRNRHMLSKFLKEGNTVAVIGSGLSRPLGYPLWKDFAEKVVKQTQKHPKIEHPRLQAFMDSLEKNPDGLDAARLKFYIGFCKSLLKSHGTLKTYYKILRGIIKRKKKFRDPVQGDPVNPYTALMELPIYRFVTTNYDLELEYAIHTIRGVEWERFGIDIKEAPSACKAAPSKKLSGMPLSFTQKLDYCDQLAMFALSDTDRNRNMVFHCHGRIDDPKSAIVSEDDYQSWYLADQDGAGPIFRQTLELLFSSNPLLFIGYGMGDEDLLRPLRILGAMDPAHKDRRPLFVILASDYENDEMTVEEKEKERESHEILFEQYGVHVIPMQRPPSDQWSGAYRETFQQIKSKMAERHWNRLQKPFFRHVKVNAKPPKPYHPIAIEPPAQLQKMRLSPPAQHDIKWMEDHISQKEPRFFVLDGPPGSGKSYHALQLFRRMSKSPQDFDGFFFWDFYLSNDGQAAIEQLIAYMQQNPAGQNDPECQEAPEPDMHLLQRLLKDKRYLIIFDGCDRLLIENESKRGEGASYSEGCRAFIPIVADASTRSTIVLVTRLFPTELNKLNKLDESGQPMVCKKTLTCMTTENLKVGTFFSRWDKNDLSELVALLDGNTTSVTLAALYLYSYNNYDSSDQSRLKTLDRWEALKTQLSNWQPKRRLSSLIDLVLNDTEADSDYNPHEATQILEIIALFGTAIDMETLEFCYGALLGFGYGELDETSKETLHKRLNELQKRHLVYQWPDQGTQFYAAPLAIRYHLFQDEHGEKSHVLPSFGVAGSTSLKPGVQPESQESAKRLAEQFDLLYDRAQQSLQKDPQCTQNFARRLFSLMRSRMDARLAAVWCDYDTYARFGLRLLHLCVAAAPKTWAYRDAKERASIEHRQGILHARELSWLYNDLGLALRAAGEAWDAYMVWEQGHQINQVMTRSQTTLSSIDDYTLQSLLNFCICFIDIGRLPDAIHYLKEAEQANQDIQDPDFKGRILGYKGLLEHLQGHLEDADRLYKRTLKTLPSANRRARAIFRLHQADLKAEVNDVTGAERVLRDCHALAEANHQRDLLLRIKIGP